VTIAVGCTGGRHRSMAWSMNGRDPPGIRDPSTGIPVCATPRCGEGMREEMIGVVVVTHCTVGGVVAAARLGGRGGAEAV